MGDGCGARMDTVAADTLDGSGFRPYSSPVKERCILEYQPATNISCNGPERLDLLGRHRHLIRRQDGKVGELGGFDRTLDGFFSGKPGVVDRHHAQYRVA